MEVQQEAYLQVAEAVLRQKSEFEPPCPLTKALVLTMALKVFRPTTSSNMVHTYIHT